MRGPYPACKTGGDEGIAPAGTLYPARAVRVPDYSQRRQWVNGVSKISDLEKHGFTNPGTVHWNLGVSALYEAALLRGEGKLSEGGAIVCTTGQHTGRSPNDKFVVKDENTADSVWWGTVNKPMSRETFARLRLRMLSYLQGRELFVQDLYAGADPAHRISVRVVTEQAWHNLFARNMFIRPSAAERHRF